MWNALVIKKIKSGVCIEDGYKKKQKMLTTLVAMFSLSVGWENGPERELKYDWFILTLNFM